MAKMYKAIKRGFDGFALREAGDVFSFEGTPGSWMKEVKSAKMDGPRDEGGHDVVEPFDEEIHVDEETGSKSHRKSKK